MNLLHLFLLFNLQYLGIIEAAPRLVGGNKLAQDVTWYCTTICEGCGGKAQVDFKIPACVCKIDSNVDDTDLLLMKDMAQKIGMTLEIQDVRSNKLSKRDVEESNESEDKTSETPKKLHPLIFKLRSRLLNPLNMTQEDSILGRSNIFDMELQHNSLLPKNPKEFKLDLGKNSYFNHKESTRNALNNMRSKIDSLIEKIDLQPESRRAMEEAEDLHEKLKDFLNKSARKSEDKFGNIGDKFGDVFQNLPKLRDIVGKSIPKKFQIQNKNKSEENESEVEDKEVDDKKSGGDKKIITQPEMFIGDDDDTEE